MTDATDEIRWLRERGTCEGSQVLGTLLARHRDRLRRMVALRLDHRLQGRIDPSDVIQEAYMEASARLSEYLNEPSVPFFLWLRFLTAQKLVTLHRHHLGVKMRNVNHEVPLDHGMVPGASTATLAGYLVGHDTRPSDAAMRAELKAHVQRALDSMAPAEREILALRHFEQLSRAEIGKVIGISEEAAGKRYIRALERLKQILGQGPCGLENIRP